MDPYSIQAVVATCIRIGNKENTGILQNTETNSPAITTSATN